MASETDGAAVSVQRTHAGTEAGLDPRVAISNEMVRIYKSLFGRGPTKVRTSFVGNDMISVLLEETLTAIERNMVRLGEHQRLRDVRMFFQYAALVDFCEPIERLTGRKVKAFLSGVDTEVEGLSIEVFVLHPEGYEGPSRAARTSAAT
jgi:uncharacterized protein YbcI